jgi:hypothetical protein
MTKTPVRASVENRAGRPTLVINERAEAPLLYALTDCPGARWTWEELPTRNIELFAKSGCRLFQADIWLAQLLDANDEMDVTLARKQIAGVIAAAPDAHVMLRVHLNATPAWCGANPDECVGYADGGAEPEQRWGLERWLGRDNDMPVRASIHSVKWQEWARRQLARFCGDLAASPEGDALFSIQVANGVFGEWHEFGFFCHDPDTSVAAVAAFRAWLEKRYGDEVGLAKGWNQPGATFAAVQAPTSAERKEAGMSILRDPATHQRVIDYFLFMHEDLADVVSSMAKVVKETWPRPIMTATFFGYFYCMFGREAAGGHLGIGRLIKSPYIDCVCATPSYTPTAMPLGGTWHSRGIVDAVRRAGKLWLDEMDRTTSVVPCPWDKSLKSTISQDVAVLRRNLLSPAMRNGGAWCYDFGPIAGTPNFVLQGNVGWWDHPVLQQEWSKIHAVVQSRVESAFVRPSDALLLHDPWSFAHLIDERHDPKRMVFGVMPTSTVDPVSRLLTDGVVEALHKSGVIHTDALLEELPDLDFSAYKLVIFATATVLTEAHRSIIREKIATEGRHVVFLAFAGWSDGRMVGPEAATALHGFATTLSKDKNTTQEIALSGVKESLALDFSLNVPTYETVPGGVVGRWEDGSVSAVRRQDAQATWWGFGLPPNTPALWREIGRLAGCHIVNETDETTMVGDGLVMIHTVAGGARMLHLPNGRSVKVALPPESTTVYSAETGETILG